MVDAVKFNLFQALGAQGGVQGVNPAQQQVQGAKAVSSGMNSSLLDRLNKMDNKFEGGQAVSNQYAGMVNGKDNYAANKLDFMA